MPVTVDGDLIFPKGTVVYTVAGAPSVSDDASTGYQVGNVWIDSTGDTIYMLADATEGAAVWRDISAGGIGGSPTGAAGGDLAGTYPNPAVVQLDQRDKTLTYNPDGTLATMADAYGTKTFQYTDGVLTAVVGTGRYSSKTLVYTGGKLTSVSVT